MLLIFLARNQSYLYHFMSSYVFNYFSLVDPAFKYCTKYRPGNVQAADRPDHRPKWRVGPSQWPGRDNRPTGHAGYNVGE